MADLATLLETTSALGQLRRALAAADMLQALRGPGPLTLFAPVDAAFGQPEAAALLADPPRLRAALRAHLAPGLALAADLMEIDELPTLAGARLTVSAADGLRLNQAYIIAADLEAENGVLHLIDRVLLPG